MPRTLMLMRHAKSDWHAPHESDFDRPLNKRGQRAATVMAEFIATLPQPPQWIVASPAVRALTTAETVAEALDEVALLKEPEMYGAGVYELLGIVRRLPEEVTSVLLVGHNPGMEWLAGELSGEPTVEVKTATLAVFELEGNWTDVGREHCTLRLLQSPRELDEAEGGD
jgi:phosphohistidine phosphatase